MCHRSGQRGSSGRKSILSNNKIIEDVEVAILLKEKEGTNGFKASLRSHETVNVSDICMMLGGGGHRGAAGCFISGSSGGSSGGGSSGGGSGGGGGGSW